MFVSLAWLETTPHELPYVSLINLAEIKKGVKSLAEGRHRRQLENWLTEELKEWFSGHILSVDRRVASAGRNLQRGI